MTVYKLLALLLIFLASTASAAPRITVLNFELNDITSLPNTPAELQRTGTMAPLLCAALTRIGDYQTVAIPTDLQQAANGGFGYLFRFPDEAAKLGQQLQADWVVVSQHSKPSFLFSYLWVYLVEVKTLTTVARYDIELKGSHAKVTQRGIESLAKRIQATIANHKNQPLPVQTNPAN